MKKTNAILLAITVACTLIVSTVSCRPNERVTIVPTPCPTPATPSASPYPSPVPTEPTLPTPRPSPQPGYSRQFLDSLPANPESCLPDQTAEDIGVYIYDLKAERELVSINADIPFQFASAFKGPVLVYFLSSCRQYWDPTSADWQTYFQDTEAAHDIAYYTSPEYEKIITEFVSNPENWKNTGNFFAKQRVTVNGANGDIDTRYFVLEKVYSMIAQSKNVATADVLQFVFANCPTRTQIKIGAECGDPNAITSFNAWFNDFAGISYEDGTQRRGLYRWDTVLENGADGTEEITLATVGLKDQCASQPAILKCDPTARATNTFTARDLFKFYSTLYNLDDEPVREAALALLKVDEPGPARGYLKNLTRSIHATALSKNGHAFFNNGSINADAGIVLYKGKSFAVVTLSFDAIASMIKLYGSYDSAGNPVGEPGLIQNLLEQYPLTP